MIEVVVHGTPAPQGSKRHVGRGIMVESSAKVAPWREAVKWAVLRVPQAESAAGGPMPLEGPLRVTCVFTLPKPASARQCGAQPAKRPDLDKLLRSTFDALGEAGVWKDDAQVVSVHASKCYPDSGVNSLSIPGARLWVEQLEAS